MKLLALTLILALAVPAHAACAFKTAQAILCDSPRAAAIAFQEFGDIPQEAAKSYNNALLHGAGCGGLFGSVAQNIDMMQARREHVPTRDGWVSVLFLRQNNDLYYWVAEPYVSGECRAATR